MLGYLKSIGSELDRLHAVLEMKNELTEFDLRNSSLPNLLVSFIIFTFKRWGDFDYFYRIKSGKQYEYYFDIPVNITDEAALVFTRPLKDQRSDGLLQADDQYFALCKRILEEGSLRGDRTGTGTIGIFGHQMRFDLSKGFPLLTTKKVFFKGVLGELLWFLTGSTNNNDLKAMGVNIWDEWAKEDGDLGPIYGKQWRKFEGVDENSFFNSDACDDESLHQGVFFKKKEIDQIADVIEQIKNNPNSRRLIVTAWHPIDMHKQSLPACHTMFQFYVQDGKLSCQLYQRSGDVFLGIPFNIASYALLTHMIAQVCGLKVGEFIHTIGDAHIYQNHIQQIKEQLTRRPMAMPKLLIDKTIKNIDDFKMEHFKIKNYNPHPVIKGDVSK